MFQPRSRSAIQFPAGNRSGDQGMGPGSRGHVRWRDAQVDNPPKPWLRKEGCRQRHPRRWEIIAFLYWDEFSTTIIQCPQMPRCTLKSSWSASVTLLRPSTSSRRSIPTKTKCCPGRRWAKWWFIFCLTYSSKWRWLTTCGDVYNKTCYMVSALL